MSDIARDIETIRLPVSGMTCSSCANRIARALRNLDGVTSVNIDLRKETVTVRREPALVSDAVLAAAVAAAGYEADVASAVVIPAGESRGLLGHLLWRGR